MDVVVTVVEAICPELVGWLTHEVVELIAPVRARLNVSVVEALLWAEMISSLNVADRTFAYVAANGTASW